MVKSVTASTKAMSSYALAILLFGVTGTLGFSWPFFHKEPAPLWNDLRVHYSPKGESDGFFQLPRTSAGARQLKYTTPAEETGSDLETLCPNSDPSICLIYGAAGNIAGIEIGILRSDVDDNGYPYDRHPVFVPKARFGYDVYVTRLFFDRQGAITSQQSKDVVTAGTGSGLWFQLGENRDHLFEMPRLEKDIGNTAYTKTNCVPGMGIHYFYNISTAMNCEDYEPIFGLYKNSQLIGFGLQTNGRATPISKVWFESIPVEAIMPMPNGPQCLVDNMRRYGVISLHVYFVDQPWAITCSN